MAQKVNSSLRKAATAKAPEVAEVKPKAVEAPEPIAVPSLRRVAKEAAQAQAEVFLVGQVTCSVTMSKKDRMDLERHIARRPHANYILNSESKGRPYSIKGRLDGISWAMDDGDNGLMTVNGVTLVPGPKGIGEGHPYDLSVQAVQASVDAYAGAEMFPIDGMREADIAAAKVTQAAQVKNLRGIAEGLVANEITARGKYQALDELRASVDHAFYQAQELLAPRAICEVLLELKDEAEAHEGTELVGVEIERGIWDNDDDTTSEWPEGHLLFKDENGEVYTSDLEVLRGDDKTFTETADELADYARELTNGLPSEGDKVRLFLDDPDTVVNVDGK